MMAPTIGAALGLMGGSKISQFAADNGWGGWEYALRMVVIMYESYNMTHIGFSLNQGS